MKVAAEIAGCIWVASGLVWLIVLVIDDPAGRSKWHWHLPIHRKARWEPLPMLPGWKDYRPVDSDAEHDLCVWCHVPGCALRVAQHTSNCPFSTHLWPVNPTQVKHGMVCDECSTQFRLGDYSTTIQAEDHVEVVVCIGCAAIASTSH